MKLCLVKKEIMYLRPISHGSTYELMWLKGMIDATLHIEHGLSLQPQPQSVAVFHY